MQEATFLIMTALAAGTQHGYGIISDVAEISGGRVTLLAGTLYTALDRLRADGLIGVDREEIVDNRLRRYYRLTPVWRGAADRRGGPAARARHGRAEAAEAEPGGRCRMSELKGRDALEPSGEDNMADSASLERGYRRLLAWYPRAFRRENEEEILAVLMACAQDGQTRPSLEAAVDLLKGAMRMRLRPRAGQPRTVFAAVRLMWPARPPSWPP